MWLVTPEWDSAPWRDLLNRLTVKKKILAEPVIFENEAGRKLPRPTWNTRVSLLDGAKCEVDEDELDPKELAFVKRRQAGLGFSHLERSEKLHSETRTRATSTEAIQTSDEATETEVVPNEGECASDSSEDEKPERLEPVRRRLDFGDDSEDGWWDDSSVMTMIQGDRRRWTTRARADPNAKIVSEQEIEEAKAAMRDANQVLVHGMSPADREGLERLRKGEAKQETTEIPKELQEVVEAFAEVFQDISPEANEGLRAVTEMDLQLRKGCEKRTVRARPYRLSPEDTAEVTKQVDSLIQKGMVEETSGSEISRFCSPCFLVSQGEKKRLVVDYSRLNEIVDPDVNSLPNLESQIEGFAAKKYKSKLDMRQGFWQVRLTDNAKEMTAMILPDGRVVRWVVMPFGINNAPAVFQELMRRILGKMKESQDWKKLIAEEGDVWVEAYVDDVSIGTLTRKAHVRAVELFLRTCRENGLKVRLEKCAFMKLEIEFLGHLLSWSDKKGGVWKPQPGKVEEIVRTQVTSLKELRSFLGMINFFRRHMKGVAGTASILTDLTRKGAVWRWSEDHERALQKLKETLANAAALGTLKGTGEILLVTDASHQGGGGFLAQWQEPPATEQSEEVSQESPHVTGVLRDGTLRKEGGQGWVLVPLGYWSRRWNKARENYSTWEKELMSGVLVLSSQRRLVEGRAVVWLTDQKALEGFFKEPPPNERVKRWWVFLSQLRLKIHHLEGAKNEFLDFLSRHDFQNRLGVETEELARDAFARMDLQLDLTLRAFPLAEVAENGVWPWERWSSEDLDAEEKEIFNTLDDGAQAITATGLWRRDGEILHHEGAVWVATRRLEEATKWAHERAAHGGIQKSTREFSRWFSTKDKKELLASVEALVKGCRICARTAPRRPEEQVSFGSLPIPGMVNAVLHIDFVSVEAHNGVDTIMVVVDGLSRFCQAWPLTKKGSDGEAVARALWNGWFSKFGVPHEIRCDRDIRFTSERGWWRTLCERS